MNVTEYVARQTERMAEALAHFIAATPEDKLGWSPALEGHAPCRSAYHQVGECIEVNSRFAKMLRGESVTSPPSLSDGLTLTSPQEAQEKLLASAKELASAIRALPEEKLSQTFQHPRGEMLGENFILMAYRNMAYHAGQVNFIQTLYGDSEFHTPPNWR